MLGNRHSIRLLNRQLREDMKRTKGPEFACPPEIDTLCFYQPQPTQDAVTIFEEYVKARWPMITFSLSPVVDEQNIEDAFSRRRDLQLAIAFALTSGRISFRQAITFTRQLQYEVQTIALNQTVSAFAHGNDTFGWKFTPRYQTPPEESNLRTVTNLVLRGGPGPNWQLDNSKIEPGLRELTAVVVMPSFVPALRLDVSSDWFRLHDPDERKLHTAKTIELGRQINEARDCLEAACKCGKYRPEEIERLRVRLHQLEVMLPHQTQFVHVPYENTLGGFSLFTQGQTALVPEISGYAGIDYFDPAAKDTELLLYGQHFSIYETAVVVGGIGLPADTGSGTTPGAGSFTVLSREILNIRIPNGVAVASREDGQSVVEVYVSTPNGISNRLDLPVKPKPPTVSVPSATAYTIQEPIITLRFNAQADGTTTKITSFKETKPSTIHVVSNTSLAIPAGSAAPPPADLAIVLQLPNNNVTPPILIPEVAAATDGTNAYVISSDQLAQFGQTYFSLLKANNLITAPLAAVNTQSITVTPSGGKSATTTNQMSVNFEYVLQPTAPAPATVPATAAVGQPATPTTSVLNANAATGVHTSSVPAPAAVESDISRDAATRRVSLASSGAPILRANLVVPPQGTGLLPGGNIGNPPNAQDRTAHLSSYPL